MYSRNTEIRHLAAADVYQLAQILEHVNSWKKLMAIIPKSLSSPKAEDTPKKYTSEQIRLIENASLKQNRTGAEILFDEWGTSGRKRPTVGNLLDLLVEAELFRAADYVAVNFLNEPVPERPTKGPAAKIDISLPFDTEEIKEVDAIMNDVSYPGSSVLMRNAKEPSEINNRDFYIKLGHDREKLNVEISDLMKFSSSTIITTELPALSELGEGSVELNSDQIPAFSQLANTQDTNASNVQRQQAIEVEESEDGEMTESQNLPALSALQMHSTNSSFHSRNESTDLPNLSALNLNVNINEHTTTNNTHATPTTGASLDEREHYLDVPSATKSLYDSDNNLTPDLSILDQSSLDDSSLTNVTETSDDLSFDAKTRLNLSENNIPMLSILQK